MGARELLADLAGAGLSVIADGDRLIIRPASKLTDDMRAGLLDAKCEVLALLAPQQQPERLGASHDAFGPLARTDNESALFVVRRDRMLRWGWSESDADALARRLVKRDRDQDIRVSCIECRHCRSGRCGNYRGAGLRLPNVGRDLPGMLQRCAGYQTVR